jgi:hypothetical protein
MFFIDTWITVTAFLQLLGPFVWSVAIMGIAFAIVFGLYGSRK